ESAVPVSVRVEKLQGLGIELKALEQGADDGGGVEGHAREDLNAPGSRDGAIHRHPSVDGEGVRSGLLGEGAVEPAVLLERESEPTELRRVSAPGRLERGLGPETNVHAQAGHERTERL